MSDTITIWNKGKRTWTLDGMDGNKVRLGPQESMEMKASKAVKLVELYHKDFTVSKVSAPNNEDLKRREQSLRDREAALDKREKELDEREKKLNGSQESDEKAALLKYAKDIGISVDGRMSIEKIKAAIKEAGKE